MDSNRNDDVIFGRKPAANVTPELPPPAAEVADTESNRKEIVEYFTRRHSRLQIAATTETPRGQLIDWIPIETQVPDGSIAAPPLEDDEAQHVAKREEHHVIPELEYFECERGPAGTVPVLRKKLDALTFDRPLAEYLAKARWHESEYSGALPPGEGRGTHWHGSTRQNVVCFGGSGEFSCFSPFVAGPDEFSLLQIGLTNRDLSHKQTVEVGWQVYKEITGDFAPHLFVYYTTNGYALDADNQGGYNLDVDGWIQHDDVIFPGSTFAPHSQIDGDQRKIRLKFQLYRNNWWLSCQGRWVGYYPSRLFMGNQSLFSTLGNHADRIGFWGEVATRATTGTKTDMGSGRFPDEGFRRAAYFHHLRIQTDRAGTMSRFTGYEWRTDENLYEVELQSDDRDGGWESYAFVGGPGSG